VLLPSAVLAEHGVDFAVKDVKIHVVVASSPESFWWMHATQSGSRSATLAGTPTPAGPLRVAGSMLMCSPVTLAAVGL